MKIAVCSANCFIVSLVFFLFLNKQRSRCKCNWAYLLVAPFSVVVKNHSACVHPPHHRTQFVKGIRLPLLQQQQSAPSKPKWFDFRHSKDCCVLCPRPTYPPPLVPLSLSLPARLSDVSDRQNKSPAVSSVPPEAVSSTTLSPFEFSTAPRRPSPKWALGELIFFPFLLCEGAPWCKFADCVALWLWNAPGSRHERPEVDA